MFTPNSVKSTFNWKKPLKPHVLAKYHSKHLNVQSIKVLTALGLVTTILLWSLHV